MFIIHTYRNERVSQSILTLENLDQAIIQRYLHAFRNEEGQCSMLLLFYCYIKLITAISLLLLMQMKIQNNVMQLANFFNWNIADCTFAKTAGTTWEYIGPLDEGFESDTITGDQCFGCSVQGKDKGAVYVGAVVKGLRQGEGFYRSSQGDMYRGEWNNDKIHGKGVYTWRDGDTHVGLWKHGLRCGKGMSTWVSGRKFEGEYLDDKKLHGVLTEKHGFQTICTFNSKGKTVKTSKGK